MLGVLLIAIALLVLFGLIRVLWSIWRGLSFILIFLVVIAFAIILLI